MQRWPHLHITCVCLPQFNGSQVGAYQAIGYSTNNVTRIGQPFTILTNIVAELGSSGDDTLAFTGTWDINPSTFGFNDVDLAITVRGTGM